MTNIETTDTGVTLNLSYAQGYALARVLGSLDDRTGVLATLADNLCEEFLTEEDLTTGGDYRLTPVLDWEPGDPTDAVAVLEVQ